EHSWMKLQIKIFASMVIVHEYTKITLSINNKEPLIPAWFQLTYPIAMFSVPGTWPKFVQVGIAALLLGHRSALILLLSVRSWLLCRRSAHSQLHILCHAPIPLLLFVTAIVYGWHTCAKL